MTALYQEPAGELLFAPPARDFSTALVVDGSARFDDDVRPGDRVQVRGVLEADGSVRAERVRLE